LLAGGHSLIPLMKLRLATPSLLIDLRKVPGLHGVEKQNGHWRIGSLTPHAALERESGFIAQLLPILTPEQKEKLATMRQRRVFAHWTEENEVWSALDEATEPNGPR